MVHRTLALRFYFNSLEDTMAIKTRLGAQRYNNRMENLMQRCRQLEHERLERGEMPNPSLTSPETARKYGWEMVGREVRPIQ